MNRTESDLDRFYSEDYAGVVHSGVTGRVQRLFHQAVERPWGSHVEFAEVLELGATNGEHLAFVRHRFVHYTMLDIRESGSARSVAALASDHDRRVDFMVGDAQELHAIPDVSKDRLISMCLLHHLPDPDGALVEWRRVLRPGGVLSVFMPCDPGAVWRAGRALTTFRSARKRGYSPRQVRYINARDHRNHVASLRWMIEGVFDRDHISLARYPFGPIDSWNANVFMVFQITKASAHGVGGT